MSVNVILPDWFFERNTEDSIREALLLLSIILTQDEDNSLYGGDWEDDLFLMRPYCRCENTLCPWCVSCTCEYAYFRDDEPIDEDTYYEAFPLGVPSIKRNVSYTTKLAWKCDFCSTGWPASLKGGGPGKSAPNFWHKPTDMKVWWYKHIGRDMITEWGTTESLYPIYECINRVVTWEEENKEED